MKIRDRVSIIQRNIKNPKFWMSARNPFDFSDIVKERCVKIVDELNSIGLKAAMNKLQSSLKPGGSSSGDLFRSFQKLPIIRMGKAEYAGIVTVGTGLNYAPIVEFYGWPSTGREPYLFMKAGADEIYDKGVSIIKKHLETL